MDEETVFRIHFDWNEPQSTSLHKHAGWELVLVLRGEVESICDGRRGLTRAGEFLELPEGSAHAIWTSTESSFDVIGRQGLGLTMVVPGEDASGGVIEVPIYGPDGPWRQEPPAGGAYTSADDLDRLRTLSQTRFRVAPARGGGRESETAG